MKRALILPFLALSACTTSTQESHNPVPVEKTDSPLGNAAPIDARVSLDHLAGPVDVVRDTWGRPHIYATSLADAMRAEGYLVATDRPMQLEFYRRVSEGRLSEILSLTSPALVDVDIAYRHIGLARTAKAQYDALPAGELRDAIEAYADGVNQAYAKLRSGEVSLPSGILGIDPSAFTDWTPVDSLAIGRFQTYLLSYDADSDLGLSSFFSAARNVFQKGDADPAIAARAGLERDLLRFAPADPATTMKGYPVLPDVAPPKKPSTFRPNPAALAAVAGYAQAMRTMRGQFTQAGFGSNNWAVAPSRSATGHALVASDPHLSLSAPSVFWPVSIQVKTADAAADMFVAGLSFPGIPGIILGHNENIGWGATVAGYDVSDAYAETLTADGKAVVWNGQEVPLQEIVEEIKLQSGSSVTYKVQVVPHHGPIVPEIVNHAVLPLDPAKGAVSIRWTGLEATTELEAVFQLLRARDVDQAREALKGFGVGAQNWMLGDTSGHILWTSHALVPTRDKRAFQWDAASYEGTLPCFVLPGDGSAEWTGYLPDDLVPWAKDPSAGYLATANNDPTGDTLDNDPSNDTLPDGSPMYLASRFDIGFREGKVQRRLEGHADPFAPEDLSAIQADEESSMGRALGAALVAAIERGQQEKAAPGKHPDLSAVVADPLWTTKTIKDLHDLLGDWAAAGYPAASGVNPDDNTALPVSSPEARNAQATLIFNAWLVRVLGRTFDDELAKTGPGLGREERAKALLRLVKSDPATLATFDPKTGDSSLWDDLGTPEVVESRHERMLRALLDALSELPADMDTWRWGAHHTLTFGAIVPFWKQLNIPPEGDAVFPTGFPRHGDCFSVDASDFNFVSLGQPLDFTYRAGPTQRFVVDLDPAGPRVINALPGGVVWDPKSPHFADEAELWRRNQTHVVPFLLDDVLAARESRTLISPK